MSDAERIAILEDRVASLERMLEKRHNFSLRLFSCVINLWAIAIELRDQVPEGPGKEGLYRELHELQENINATQEMSGNIVETFPAE